MNKIFTHKIFTRRFFQLLFLIFFLIVFYGFHKFANGFHAKKKTEFTVGIIKTATHPALNEAQKGFIDTLHTINPHIFFIEKNAEGSVATLQIIADEMHSDPNINLIYTIATPALAAMSQKEKIKPIIFTAVTDPTILHLNQENICGISDAVDETYLLDKTFNLLPKSHSFAILFNPSEINSVLSKNRMMQYAKEHDYKAHEYAVTSPLEIKVVLEQIESVDFVILPADNLLALAISLITETLKQRNIPCISCFPVEKDVLLYAGTDYYKAGEKVAAIAIILLKKEKKPKDFGFTKLNVDTLKYNEILLNHFNTMQKTIHKKGAL